MDPSDQRSSRRLQAVGSVVLRIDGHGLEAVPLDVSMGGARLQVGPGPQPCTPWPGARVHLDFTRPRGRPAFSVEAVVVRCGGGGSDVSLRFELDSAGEDRLRSFLASEARHLGIRVRDVQARPAGPAHPPPPEEPGRSLPPWLLPAALLAGALAVIAAVVLLLR